MKTAPLDRPMEPTPLTAGVETMKAIVQDEYGTAPEVVLRIEEVARPTIGDDEVLVQVRAASVDRGTWHAMAGLPYLIRIAGFGLRAPKAPNPGRSVAGTVESVGKDVTGFEPGDEVYGTCDGSFAEYAAARARRLAPKPANVSFEQAAAVPVSALAALQAVRDRARVQAGQKVLIIGASGGVGTFAVQIAKAFGAEVTGVCSTAKTELVRAIGADHVVDYTREDFTRSGGPYDLAIDIAGSRPFSAYRRLLAEGATAVIVGGSKRNRWLGPLGNVIRARVASIGKSQRVVFFVADVNRDDLSFLRELIEQGKVRPVIDSTYGLSDVPDAIRHLAEGHPHGKIVISV